MLMRLGHGQQLSISAKFSRLCKFSRSIVLKQGRPRPLPPQRVRDSPPGPFGRLVAAWVVRLASPFCFFVAERVTWAGTASATLSVSVPVSVSVLSSGLSPPSAFVGWPLNWAVKRRRRVARALVLRRHCLDRFGLLHLTGARLFGQPQLVDLWWSPKRCCVTHYPQRHTILYLYTTLCPALWRRCCSVSRPLPPQRVRDSPLGPLFDPSAAFPIAH
eukprot:COSAG02_NODE_2192_length_9559_cov_4.170085_2_plen_217_part_00